MKNFRLLLSKIYFLLLPALVFGNTTNTITGAFCGWDPSWNDTYYPIVDQYELVDPEFHAFLNCPNTPFCDNIPNQFPVSNIKEWVSYFEDDFTEKELTDLIFERPLEWFLGKNGYENYDDDLGKRFKKSKYRFFKQYLILAKQTEDSYSDSSSYSGWYQGEREENTDAQRTVDKRELLSKALELVAIAPDQFMKNRAGFQAVKLAHYLQENEAAIRYFNTILKKTQEHNYIYYRAMEQMAGAAYNQNLQILAANSYLEVYKQLPDRRSVCAVSLRFLNWELLEKNFEFNNAGKNNDIKSFFKAFHSRGDVLQEMENIAEFNVNSAYLEILAVRLLDQMQSRIFEHNAYDYYHDDESGSNAKELSLFIKTILNHKKLKNRDLWSLLLATSYLSQNENALALNYMNSIKPTAKYIKHFKRLKTAILFMGIKSIDRQKINQSFELIAMDKELNTHKPTVAAFFNHISALYQDANNPITSVLASVDYDSYSNGNAYDWTSVDVSHGANWEYNAKYFYLSENYINNFDQFVRLKNPTSFEKTILKRMKAAPMDYIHDLRGTYYMRQDQLEEAVKEFKKVKKPEVFWDKGVRTELFSASIKEYMNVPFTSISNDYHKKYENVLGENVVIIEPEREREAYKDNKIKLAETLIKLKKLAQTDTDNTADYYYMIGNAWYNISYLGWFVNNSYYISNNYRNSLSGSSYGDDDEIKIDNGFILEHANSYLIKGLETANGSRETKAAIVFMLAKTNSCEDGRYDYDTNKYTFNICGKHREYFNQMKKEYSDTEYYQEVLKECSWFRNFVK